MPEKLESGAQLALEERVDRAETWVENIVEQLCRVQSRSATAWHGALGRSGKPCASKTRIERLEALTEEANFLITQIDSDICVWKKRASEMCKKESDANA
jgi:hypothetical protein